MIKQRDHLIDFGADQIDGGLQLGAQLESGGLEFRAQQQRRCVQVCFRQQVRAVALHQLRDQVGRVLGDAGLLQRFEDASAAHDPAHSIAPQPRRRSMPPLP